MKDILTNRHFQITVAVVFISLSAIFAIWGAPARFPISSNFNVPDGSALTTISKDLKSAEIIKSSLAFQFFVIIFGGDKHIIAGDYFLDRPLPVFSVAYRLSKGKYNQKGIRITIQEGYTVSDIANTIVKKLPNFNKDRFLSLAEGSEGYLFPDTYYFFPSIKPEEVIRVMKNNFNEKVSHLSGDIELSGKKIEEIVTMASIIEKETGPKDDRSIISGILWKRIEIGMRLQVDVEPGTYKYYGLPEKPIANPGIFAIEAALNPKESQYLYYVHDSNGFVYYAKTFEEHKRNIRNHL